MKCKVCIKNKGVSNNGLVICEECLSPASMKLITKTHAQRRYVLSAKDLQGVRHALGWSNGHNLASSLYVIDDVEKVAIQKYGSYENVIKKIKERDNRKNDIEKRNKDIKTSRRKQLNKYLIDIGLNGIRDDSIICQEYIDNGSKSDYTLEKIGDIMLEMEFYNTITDYQNQLRIVRTELKSALGKCVDDDDIREETRHRCLHKYVKDNYMNHHKMIDELPSTLREEAFQISNAYYTNGIENYNYDNDYDLDNFNSKPTPDSSIV